MFKLKLNSVAFPCTFDQRTIAVIKHLPDFAQFVADSTFRLSYDNDNNLEVDWARDQLVSSRMYVMAEKIDNILYGDAATYTCMNAVVSDKQDKDGLLAINFVLESKSDNDAVSFAPLMCGYFELVCEDKQYIEHTLIEEAKHLADQVVQQMQTKKVGGRDLPVKLDNVARVSWDRVFHVLSGHVGEFINAGLRRELKTKNPYLRFFIHPVIRTDVKHHRSFKIEIVLFNDIAAQVYSGERVIVNLD